MRWSARVAHIDASTFLLAKWTGTDNVNGQTVTRETVFHDYREVGGLKFAFELVSSSPDTDVTQRIVVEKIEIDPQICGGKPRIAGHRITVANIVVWHERVGKTPDEIADEHDLTLADIYAALAYYFDYREEIDRSFNAEYSREEKH